MNYRVILVALYILLGISSEYFLLWLFPYTGLGGLICYPISVLVSFAFGYIFYRVLKEIKKKVVLVFIFLFLFISQSIIQMLFCPQDYGGSVFSKISDAVTAYNNYNKIQFSGVLNLNRNELPVYIYKYKNYLPSSFIIMTIDSGRYHNSKPRTYVIQNNNDKRSYEKDLINIIESDTATFISEFIHGDTFRYKMNRNFMNIGMGGFSDSTVSINIQQEDLKLDTGIEKLLYSITSLTKKPIK